GQKSSQIVLGKHSGRHAFSDTLTKMGINIRGDALNAAFTRFKELADRKMDITEADLEAIVAEELGTVATDAFSLEELKVSGGTVGTPQATVVVSSAAGRVEASAEGNGMIDAAGQAIQKATSINANLIGFSVSSITGGVDAIGDVVIQLESDGVKVSGKGISTDVVEASARAYLNAINRLQRALARREAAEREVGP
nr:2-isopropylmalate synthase [Actinomycetota bacterium]